MSQEKEKKSVSINSIPKNEKKVRKKEITKSTEKKRGRPKKDPLKPVGRNEKAKTTEELAKEELLQEKRKKEIEKNKKIEKKKKEKEERKKEKEAKIRAKISAKCLKQGEYEYYYGNLKRSNIGKIKTILVPILIVIFIISIYCFINYYYDSRQITPTKEKYEAIANRVFTETENSDFDEVNFQELKTINSEAVAWIKIENTSINYPIIQSTNNEYYANHNIYRENDTYGAIYLDYQNDQNLTDKNVVIYGNQNIKDMMFYDLSKIVTGDLGSSIDIDIYTPKKSMKFKVFSAYLSKSKESIDVTLSKKNYQDYIEKVSRYSQNKFDADLDKGSQIITLASSDESGKEQVILYAILEETENL